MSLAPETLLAQAGPYDPIVKVWLDRRAKSQQLKQLYEAGWRYKWAQYRAFASPLTGSNDWWRSNEVIPTIFKIIHTLLPRFVLGMFQQPEWFTVEVRNARAAGTEDLVASLLRASIEDMNLFPKMYEALLYSLIMGHSWGKSVWREDYEPRQVLLPTEISFREAFRAHLTEQEVDVLAQLYLDQIDQPSGVMGMETQIVEEETFNGPDFEWLPVDRVFPDPTGAGKWFIEDIQTTLEELYDTQEKLDVYSDKALSDLTAALSNTPGGVGGMETRGTGGGMAGGANGAGGMAFDYQREPQSTEGIPDYLVSPMRDGTGVRLQQCWGWVSPRLRKYPDTQWRLCVIAESRYVLRDVPSPTPDQRPPYFPIKSIVVPNRLYGESLISWVGPLADQQTRLANMRLDEVFLNVWGQFMARKESVVSDNQLFFQPGGIIQVEPKNGEKVSDTFTRLQRDPVKGEAYQEDAYRQKQAEDASFANELFQGATPAGGTTATEVERRLQQGGAPHVLQVMYNDQTVAKELLKRTWRWLQMRLPHTKMVRMAGDQWGMVNIADLQIPIDIIVGGGMTALSKDARVQMDQELLQMAANPLFAQYIIPDRLLMKWARDRGWRDPENYIKTQLQLMQEQQAAMMQQAQMGMGGQGGGMDQGQGGAAQDQGGATPAQAGENGQANLPQGAQMPDLSGQGASASLVGNSLAPGGMVAPSI